jgi:hypothetical protein
LRRGSGNEAVFLREQTKAWQSLAEPPDGTVKIPVLDKNGDEHMITVKPQLALFNFPVNSGAQGNKLVQGLVGGHFTSDGMNTKAFEQLFGADFMKDGGKPDGTVDERLAYLRAPGGIVGEQLANLPDNAEGDATRQKVLTLARQCRDIWNDTGQRASGQDPYRLPARLAVLTSLLGTPPTFNCKSGKDRTGQMDVECKTLAVQVSTGVIPAPGTEHEVSSSHLRSEMAVASGNLDAQTANTGLPGFKTAGVAGLDLTMEKPTALTAQRGFSSAVSG